MPAPSGDRSTPPKREDGKRNRKALIESALTLFPRTGASLPLARVATEARLSRATMHRHFPTRESLVLAVYESVQAESQTRAQHLSAQPDGVVHALRAMAHAQRQLRGCPQVLMGSPAGREALDPIRESTHETLRHILTEGQQLGVFSLKLDVADLELLLSMIEGIISSSPSETTGVEIDRTIDIFCAAFVVDHTISSRACSIH